MVRDVNLIGYLPTFIQEYIEIRQIMSAETPEIQMLEDGTERLKRNQYILSCNEAGIARFEEMLGIIPGYEDNLEMRISRVITRWNNTLPYTLRGLNDRLKIMCGEDNYQILPRFNDYELELVVNLPIRGQFDELKNMLSYMLPANIFWKCRNIILEKLDAKLRIGGCVVKNKTITISTAE